jgi:hypothetical protein
MENIKIPYIVIDRRNRSEIIVERETVCKNDIQETLLQVLQKSMEYHEFWFIDKEKIFEVDSVSKNLAIDEKLENLETVTGLECDEYSCQVILEKYITIVNEVNYCGACKPYNTINKEIYDRFQKFLNNKTAASEIWYFDNGDWIKFMA